MKTTGMVRRLDPLGRIVIPKEIRRVFRIGDGDLLELYTDNQGSIIFRKYSPLGEFVDLSKRICNSFAKATDKIAVITDRDTVIAAAGKADKAIADNEISADLREIMEQRGTYTSDNKKAVYVTDRDTMHRVIIAVPILNAGDIVGCAVLISKDETATWNEMDVMLAQLIAELVRQQLDT